MCMSREWREVLGLKVMSWSYSLYGVSVYFVLRQGRWNVSLLGIMSVSSPLGTR